MKNKKQLQIIFFAALAAGLVLYVFPATKTFGTMLLCFVQPAIGLYYLSALQQEEINIDVLPWRYPLLLMLQITFIGLSIHILFKTMQWPFGGPFRVLVFALYVTTSLLAVVYIIVNSKIIQSAFLIEIVILMLPIILFAGAYMPGTMPKKEYAEALIREYYALEKIEEQLFDKNTDPHKLPVLAKINDINKSVIDMNGGVNEDGYIAGSLKKADPERIASDSDMLKTYNIGEGDAVLLKLSDSKTVIEYLNALTELQIEILLKSN